jgi:glutamine synthetase
VSEAELVALVACDLGAIVRGRAVFASELDEHLDAGIGWVPANVALTPLGPLAEPNPFGATGDVRLMPDAETHVRVGAAPGESALEMVLCDIVDTDGHPWPCCPRTFCKRALAELQERTGAIVSASFEHEFQLLTAERPPLPFSLAAIRAAEPFATTLMGALVEAGVEPERFFAEFASHQFEVPVAPATGLEAADRAVVLREVVREIALRGGLRATFTPLLDAAQAGNGVHVHVSLHGGDGEPLLYDRARQGCLSELGGSFSAGVLAHARSLSALCAPSAISAERLRPHRWSAGAACLGDRNRETLLRIPPLIGTGSSAAPGGGGSARQMRLEYRGADAAANPYVALGALVHAGLDGIEAGLPAPPLLDRDPATLAPEEHERFGVGALPGSLEEALAALAADDAARAWLGAELYDAYTSVKRAELVVTAGLDLEESCARYAEVY